jgi:integrase
MAMPRLLMDAFTALALSWGWVRTAAMIRLCFFAMLRPGEGLAARRRHLALPEDLCQDPSSTRVFLAIDVAKTMQTGPRQQHGRSDDPLTRHLWTALVQAAPREEPLWSAPPHAFRARWNRLCQALQVPSTEIDGVTPASLRGGGATALYDESENMELVRHRGRWSSPKMCELYVQEVGGHRFLASLEPQTRARAATLADRLPDFGNRALWLLHRGVQAETFPQYFNTPDCRT